MECTAMSRSSSGWQVIGFDVITSAVVTLLGSRLSATTLIARSRSVMMPTSFLLLRLSQTGREPTSSVFIVLATLLTVSVGIQQTGSGGMTCLHFISTLLCLMEE